MNELVSMPISPWYSIPAAVGLLALTFVFLPGLFLHLAVLIYPKGHPRRREFTAELYTVPFIKRPFWVAGTLVRCLFEGLPARIQSIRLRRQRAYTVEEWQRLFTGPIPTQEEYLNSLSPSHCMSVKIKLWLIRQRLHRQLERLRDGRLE